MSIQFIYICLISAILRTGSDGPDQKISVHADHLPFDKFAIEIYEKSGVTLFYREEWVKAIEVTMDHDSITVRMALNEAVAGYGLEVSEWNGNIVLIPGKALTSRLPDYEQADIEKENISAGEKTDSITESEERYLKGRKADIPGTYRIGSKSNLNGKEKVKVLGRILEQQSGEPVIGATVYIEETKSGVITDRNGYFSLVMKPGKYSVRIESIGYEKKKSEFEILSSGNFTVELARSIIPLEEVVIMGNRQKSNISRDPGLENIPLTSLKDIPMLMGERDIIKVSELLPGIVSVGEGSAGINVRGGNFDQNAFYINKVPVYNTSHLFGFFPAFNSDIIRDFNVYKGYIPARFGGRLSSVFNMITRQGNRKEYTARGGINPVSANLTVEGPLVRNVSSFLVSGRSSWSDWILSNINDYDISHSQARFNDLSVSLNYDLKKSQLSVFGYHSFDHFKLSDLNLFEYSNSGYSFNLRRDFTPGLHMDAALVYANYSFKTIDTQVEEKAYQHRYEINHYEFRDDFRHVLSTKHTLEYGLDAILYDLDRGDVLPFGAGSIRTPLRLGKEQGLESAVYISDNYDLMSWIHLSLGLRYVAYTMLGPGEVYKYAAGEPVDARHISDTLSFGRNSPVKWYTAPEIRAALNVETGTGSSVKLAFNQMHQDLFMLNTTITLAPNTQWQLAGYHLAPSKTDQLSLGYFKDLKGGVWETSVEVFGKLTGNYTEFRDGADFLDNRIVETNVLQGDQKAYGLEFYIERRRRKLGGWISYTWSRSLVQVKGDATWNTINGGEVYPSNFDVPHVMNAVINYHFSRRVTLSSIISYQSGRPVTYPVATYYYKNIPYTDFSKRNAYRIPDYFRTDLSLTVEGNLKKKKPLHGTLLFNVYNITGRKNPYSVFFTTDGAWIKSYKYAVIGVPFFTVTWLFKLGNYASE